MLWLHFCIPLPSIPLTPNARRRTDQGESNPTVTQLPPGTSASKSIQNRPGGEVPQNGPFGDYHPQTPYSHFVRNEQLRHAWQLAFVKRSRYTVIYIILYIYTRIYDLWAGDKVGTKESRSRSGRRPSLRLEMACEFRLRCKCMCLQNLIQSRRKEETAVGTI